MKQITANVYIAEVSAGCNPGVLVTSEGLVLFDTPFCPNEAQAWRDELRQLGEVVYLINTEPHFDHVAGAYFLPGIVVATQASRNALIHPGETEKARERLLTEWPDAQPLLEGFRFRLPDITFSDRLTLHLGDHTLHLYALPGHSSGNLAVHIPEEKVVFTGDNLVNRQGPLFHVAVPNVWRESIKTIEALEPGIIVPGHGNPCDGSYIRGFAGELDEIIGMVKRAIERGLSKQETIAQVDFSSINLRNGIPVSERRLAHQANGVKRIYEVLTGEVREKDLLR